MMRLVVLFARKGEMGAVGEHGSRDLKNAEISNFRFEISEAG
jgi:hypothetical protein